MQGHPIALDYQRPLPKPPKVSGHILAAILMGLLTCVPLLSGLTVFALVREGRNRIASGTRRGEGLAYLAILIGVLNLIVTTLATGWLVWYLLVGRERANTIRSMGNLRSIAVGIMMYATENKGHLPATLDSLAAYRLPPQVFRSPRGDPAAPALTLRFGPCDYLYAPPADRVTKLRQPAQVPVLYEPPAHYKHLKTVVGFADGHVELVSGPRMMALIQTVESNRAAATQPALRPTTP